MGTLTGARLWLQGKKTILGGGLLILAAVLGVGFGQLSPVDALAVAGFGFSICGFSAKTERHQSQVLTALEAVATAGVDLRLGDKAGALAALRPVVTAAIAEAGPALSVHVSGSDTGAVMQGVSDLRVQAAVSAEPTTGQIDRALLRRVTAIDQPAPNAGTGECK